MLDSLPPVPAGHVRVAFLGDVVGDCGRQAVLGTVDRLRRVGTSLVVANGENASGGDGLAAREVRSLLGGGVDVLTTGNHVWRHKDLLPVLESDPRVLRPANFPPGAPGRGHGVFRLPDGTPFLVINLIGRSFMSPADCPFRAADAILAAAAPGGRIPSLVDFHAEATGEKLVLCHHLDGRVSALLGTHTHVQTSDARVSPRGTGRMTDVGMCGAGDAIIGFDADLVLKRFLTLRPFPYRPVDTAPTVEGALLDVAIADGRCLAVRAIRVP